MTDQFTLRIYRAICQAYSEQIKLNLDLVTDLDAEKKLHKLPYIYPKEQISLTVDAFSCKFTDAFEIKSRYDKILLPKERYYYFKNGPVEAPAVPVIVAPAKPKRVYKTRLRPSMPALPKISLIKQVLLYLSAA